MAQLIQAHNDSHIVSPGHAPNAPLIQAATPPPTQFRVTGTDPNERPDDRSVWNEQTKQWERGTVAYANQNARLADERRGQMAFEADMRRQFSTQNGLGNLSMPTSGDLDAVMGRVVKGARNRAAAAGLPGAPVASPNGKSSVTFTGGGNPAEAATVDPMARWMEAAAFLRDADGNIKEGWQEQAKWLEGQMQAEWGRKYGFENGASVAKEITGAQGARGNTPRLDEYLQSVGAAPQGGETGATPQGIAPGATAPGTTEPATPTTEAPAAGKAATTTPAAKPARRGKFSIKKNDGSYAIEGEGNEFVETVKENGQTIDRQGTLDELPVGSVNSNVKPLETAAAVYDNELGEEAENMVKTPEGLEAAKNKVAELQALKDSYEKKGQAFSPNLQHQLEALNRLIYKTTHK